MATKKQDDGLFFIGKVNQDFSLNLYGNKLELFLSQFLNEDVEVFIKKVKVTKTIQQIRYWFGVVIPHIIEFIAETEGVRHNKDKIHVFLMSSFGDLTIESFTIMGRTFQTIERGSLADYSKEQTMILIDTVIAHFALKGLDIPQPGPTGTLSDY